MGFVVSNQKDPKDAIKWTTWEGGMVLLNPRRQGKTAFQDMMLNRNPSTSATTNVAATATGDDLAYSEALREIIWQREKIDEALLRAAGPGFYGKDPETDEPIELRPTSSSKELKEPDEPGWGQW